jgi:hypothetical protein
MRRSDVPVLCETFHEEEEVTHFRIDRIKRNPSFPGWLVREELWDSKWVIEEPVTVDVVQSVLDAIETYQAAVLPGDPLLDYCEAFGLPLPATAS